MDINWEIENEKERVNWETEKPYEPSKEKVELESLTLGKFEAPANWYTKELTRSLFSKIEDPDLALAATKDLGFALKTALHVDPDLADFWDKFSRRERIKIPVDGIEIDRAKAFSQIKAVKELLELKDENGNYLYPITRAWMANPKEAVKYIKSAEALTKLEALHLAYNADKWTKLQAWVKEGGKNLLSSGAGFFAVLEQFLARMNELNTEEIGKYGSLLPKEQLEQVKRDAVIKWLEKRPITKWAKEVQKAPWLTPYPNYEKGLSWFSRIVIEQAPRMAATVGLSVIHPAVGIGFFSSQIAGGSFLDYSNISNDDFYNAVFASANALLQAPFEYMKLGVFFKLLKTTPTTKNLAKLFLTGSIQEFLQEFVESGTQIGAEAAGDKEKGFAWAFKEYGKRFGETFANGIVSGLAVLPYEVLFGFLPTLQQIKIDKAKIEINNYLNSLSEAIEKDPAFKNNPDKAADFIEKLNPNNKLQIKKEDTQIYFQDKPEDKRKILSELGAEAEFKRANTENDEFFTVSIGKYVAAISEEAKGFKKKIQETGAFQITPGSNIGAGEIVDITGDEKALNKIEEEIEAKIKEFMEDRVPPDWLAKKRAYLIDKLGYTAAEADVNLIFMYAGLRMAANREGMSLEDYLKEKAPEIIEGTETTEGKPGSYNPDKNLVAILKAGKNKATFIHEAIHVFMQQLKSFAENEKASEEIKKDWAILNEIEKKEGTEGLVKLFENYLVSSRAPSVDLLDAFDTISDWLTAVYGNLQHSKDLQVSDEVKDVFNRMLATEEEIKLLNSIYPDISSLSEQIGQEAVKKIGKKKAKAKRKAKRGIVANLLKNYFEIASKKVHKNKAIEEINETAPYKYIKDIQESGGISLEDIDAYLEDAGLNKKEIKKKLRRFKGLILKEGKIKLQEAVSKYGYKDADEMIKAFAEAETFNNAVKRRYKEIIEDAELRLADHAKFAFNNENLNYIIAASNVLINKIRKTKKSGLKRGTAIVIKNEAKNKLRNLPVKEAVKYKKYARKCVALGKEIAKAIRKKDIETAAELLQKQALYHAFTMQAIENKKKIDKYRKKWTKRKIEQLIKNVTEPYKEAILRLNYVYKLSKNPTKLPKNKDAKAIGGPDFDNIIVDSTENWLLSLNLPGEIDPNAYTDPFNWFDLASFEKLATLYDIIEKRGRGELNYLKLQKKETAEEIVKTLVEIGEREHPEDNGVINTQSLRGRIKKWIAEKLFPLVEARTIAEEFDGFPMEKKHGLPGLLYSLVQKGIEANVDGENLLKSIKKDLVGIGKIFHDIKKRTGSLYIDENIVGVKIPDKLKIYRGTDKWSIGMLISLVQYSGDAHCYELLKAPEGYGLSDEDIAKIQSFFTAKELDAIQKTIDAVNFFWPMMKETNKKLTGQEPVKEKAREAIIRTKDGKDYKFKGGYFPVIFDPLLDPKAAARNEKTEAERIAAQHDLYFKNSLKVKDGHTIDRLKNPDGTPLVKRPLLLSEYNFLRHLKWVTHYISHATYLDDMNRIINHSNFRDIMVRKLGWDAYNFFKRAFQRQAKPEGEYQGAWELTGLRRLAHAAAIGFKTLTGLKQRLSIFQAALKMSKFTGNPFTAWKYILKGFQRAGLGASTLGLQSNSMVQEVYRLSAYMKNRAPTFGQRDVQDFLSQLLPMEGVMVKIPGTEIEMTRKEFLNTSYFFLRMNDTATVVPLWFGNYIMYKEINPNNKGPFELEKEAVRWADSVIQETQPSALSLEQSSLQAKRGLWRLLTVFMTFRFKQGNLLIKSLRAFKKGKITSTDLAYHTIMNIFMPVWTGLLLQSILFDDDEKPAWWEWIATGPLEEAVSWIPVIRDIPSTARMGKGGMAPLYTEPLVRIVKAAQKTQKAFDKNTIDAWENMIWHLYKAVEIWGLPPFSNVPTEYNKLYKKITGEK